MKKLALYSLALLALVYAWTNIPNSPVDYASETTGDRVFDLYQQRISGKMVSVSGLVDKILPDDNEGNRHQRFIVRADDRLTILIAHNIDLADRVPVSLHESIEIYGQYEWNEKGGVVHWTHADPQNRRIGGWINYQGRVYE